MIRRIVVWEVTMDSQASFYKELIAQTEFLRHKIEDDERFPPHGSEVLELGKDVHLLDLQSTSIFTTRPMELYSIYVDNGELEKLKTGGFVPKKRIAHYEQQLNRALFELSEEEEKDNQAILNGEKVGMSTSLQG